MAGFLAVLGLLAAIVVFIGGLVSGAGLGMSILLAIVIMAVFAFAVSLLS